MVELCGPSFSRSFLTLRNAPMHQERQMDLHCLQVGGPIAADPFDKFFKDAPANLYK